MISDHDFMNTSDLTWSLWTPIIHDQYHTKGPYVWSVIMDDFLLFMHDSGDRHYETLLIIDDHCWSVHHIMHDQWWSCYEKLVIIDDKYWSVHHIMTPNWAIFSNLGWKPSIKNVARLATKKYDKPSDKNKILPKCQTVPKTLNLKRGPKCSRLIEYAL